jgi:Uma2 family endonuclease
MDTDTGVLPPRLLTVAEYRRMAEAGVFGEDERVELLDGQVVAIAPIGPRHALTVDVLSRWFGGKQDRWWARFQNPVDLDERTEPSPDIVLARMPWRGYPHSHPGPADIVLVIEVADSTLRRDLANKLPLYARNAVAGVWIVDLTVDRVMVHRDPDPETQRYRTSFAVGPDGDLDIAGLPGITRAAGPLFRPPPVEDLSAGR